LKRKLLWQIDAFALLTPEGDDHVANSSP
jgi:hypothetical protein